MKTSEVLTLLGIVAAVYGIYATRQSLTSSGTTSRQNPKLRKSREFAGAGVDPYGSGYTVEKQAAAGGL